MSLLSLDQIKTLYDDLRGRIEDGGSVINFLPVDNASGSIDSFPDGANDVPVKSLVAQITPVQDLHGQSAPYPAGGGKNLFDPSNLSSRSSFYTVNANESITVTATDTTVWENITALSLKAGTYTVHTDGYTSGNYQYVTSEDGYTTVSTIGATAISTFTLTADGGIKIKFGTGGATLPQTIKVQIEAGQTSTTWTPFSNICPISGWTGANVNVTGINVWDEEWEVGAINDTTGENQPANDNIRSKNYIPVKPNATYYGEANGYSLRKYYYDINKNLISHTTNTTGAFTTPENCAFLRFRTGSLNNTPYGTTYNNDISINYPSTDTSYHAYNGSVLNIDWTDEAGTVYGGTLNVTTGLLTIENILFTPASISYYGTYGDDNAPLFYVTVATPVKVYATTNDPIANKIYSNKYAATDVATNQALKNCHIRTQGSVATATIFYFRDDRFTSAAEINADLANNPLQIMAVLATPQTYQLTPTEVKTLLGDNNIFVDTGDVSVDYRADIALYIQKVVNA